MKLAAPLDAKLNQLLNIILQKLAADPTFAAGEAGRVWMNTTGSVLKWNNGAAIVTLRDSGTLLVNGDIAAGAAIALTKLAVDPLARANHTGTQLANTISNFDTQVRTSRLDQMAAPTAAVAFGSQKITGLADPTAAQEGATKAYVDTASTADRNRANHTGTQLAATISDFTTAVNAQADSRPLSSHAAATASVDAGSQKIINLAAPTAANDATNKQYVDGVAQGLSVKPSVTLATTAALPANTQGGAGTTLTANANGALPAIDGIVPSAGDLLLVKNEAASQNNGIYVVTAAGSAGAPYVLTRIAQADTWAELVGAFTFVELGAVNASSGWVTTIGPGGTLGTTAIAWTQFSGAGAIVAGNGLTKTGNTLDVGPAAGIVVAADTVGVDTTIIPRYWTNGGTHAAGGTTLSYSAATMGLGGFQDAVISVQVIEVSTGDVILPDVNVSGVGLLTITFTNTLTANQYRVSVVGRT